MFFFRKKKKSQEKTNLVIQEELPVVPIIEAKENKELEENQKILNDQRNTENETNESNKRQYLGKYIVYQDKTQFRFVLLASNGELLCTSEKYESKKGLLDGIETFKKNVENGNFLITEDKHNFFVFTLLSKTNRIIILGETYSTRKKCESAVESVKKFAINANLVQKEEEIATHYQIEEDSFFYDDKDYDVNGKYEVFQSDEKFKYRLKASNGVILFESKDFMTKATCLNNIELFQKNIALNHFRIYKNKNGLFCFKIYNEQNTLTMIGEFYETSLRCKNALASVCRFAKDAKIVELSTTQ